MRPAPAAASRWVVLATRSNTLNITDPTIESASWFDRTLARVAPGIASRRAEARANLAVWDHARQFVNSYRGGLSTRLGTSYPASQGQTGTNTPLRSTTLRAMRDRSRNLDRNNALAAALLDRACENVIGHGMKLQALTDDEDFNDAAEALWCDWWENKADVRGMLTGAQLESLLYRAHLCDGDVGGVLLDLNNGRPDGLLIQAVTGDYIDTAAGGYDTKTRTYEGITWNEFWRPLAFNVLVDDPANYTRKSVPVPARDFIFYPRMKSTRQLRGEPAFATIFDLFDQTTGIIDASAVAVRIAACQAMLIKKAAAGTAFGALGSVTNSQGTAQQALTIEPGMVHYLQPGEEVESFNPNQPQQNLTEFIRLLIRTAGLSLGLPLEILMLDFSQSNYSNARAALLQLQRACRPQQRLFCKRVMSRIYQWRISKAVNNGELALPDSIKDTFWSHNFLPPGWAWVDPEKDLSAKLTALDAGLTSKAQICAEQGEEYENIRAVRAKEIEDDAAAGLPEVRSNHTRDPMPAPAPASPPQPAPDDTEDETDAAD